MMTDADKYELARSIVRTIDLLKNRAFGCLPDETVFPSLTGRQIVLLMTVREKSGISIKELADAMGVTTSSVSTMVERLVEAGMVTREPNPSDRRGVLVRVAPHLEAAIDLMEKQTLRWLVELLDKLGPETTQLWRELDARICSVLGEKQAESNA